MSARFASLLVSGHFAIDAATYWDHYYPESGPGARIVLPVVVEHILTTRAILDTGAPWCIFNPRTLAEARVVVTADAGSPARLLARGTVYDGTLLRATLRLDGEAGENLTVDATTFVSILHPDDTWSHPNFLGLDGFLNRSRFAVDPGENSFYFGPL